MRILWLKTEPLHPIDKGGKIRTYQMLKEMVKSGHHVTYLTLDDGTAASDAFESASEYSSEIVVIKHRTAAKFSTKFYVELMLNLASNLPYALQKYVSVAMQTAVKSLTADNNFDILVCDFLAPSVNVPPDLTIPTLLFQHNVEAVLWKRHFEVARNPIKKVFLRSQWKKMEAYEGRACRKFDSVVAVSMDDAETMKREYGVAKILDVPTGVDIEYFRPVTLSVRNSSEVVFTGSMDWLPNVDAIQWFTSEILPLIRARIPNVRFTVVGRNPDASLMELGQKNTMINITGRVPDVRPYMDKAGVYVVPIRIGGGTRLKIYEAMAMGLPIVSTTVGAEGLSVTDGTDIVLRDDPSAFAKEVANLLTDRHTAQLIGQAAAKNMRKNFDWRKVSNRFVETCAATIRRS